MKKITFNKLTLLLVCFFAVSSSFAQKAKKAEKNKFLENRKFKVQFYEMKAAGRGKALASMVNIGHGKIESDLMKEKIKAEPSSYKITLDSTYTEDENEIHMVTIEGSVAEKKDEIKWEATITNYDIEGTVTMMRDGTEKKKFEFSGSEKAKK